MVFKIIVSISENYLYLWYKKWKDIDDLKGIERYQFVFKDAKAKSLVYFWDGFVGKLNEIIVKASYSFNSQKMIAIFNSNLT